MADALHQQCVDGVVAILKGLSLAGIGTNVVTQLIEDEGNLTYPLLRVSIEGEAELVSNFTSASRLWMLPVRVELIDRIAGPAPEKMAPWTGWRERIVDAFPDKRQDALPRAVHGCEIDFDAVIRANPHAYQRPLGAMVLRFRVVRPQ